MRWILHFPITRVARGSFGEFSASVVLFCLHTFGDVAKQLARSAYIVLSGCLRDTTALVMAIASMVIACAMWATGAHIYCLS